MTGPGNASILEPCWIGFECRFAPNKAILPNLKNRLGGYGDAFVVMPSGVMRCDLRRVSRSPQDINDSGTIYSSSLPQCRCPWEDTSAAFVSLPHQVPLPELDLAYNTNTLPYPVATTRAR